MTVRSDKVAPESELAEALAVHLLQPQRHGPELALGARRGQRRLGRRAALRNLGRLGGGALALEDAGEGLLCRHGFFAPLRTCVMT